MGTTETLLYSVIGSAIFTALLEIIKRYRKKNLRDDIEFIEYEKAHLSEMKRSNFAMTRLSFRSLFLILMLIGLAKTMSHILALAEPKVFYWANDIMGVVLWVVITTQSFIFWRRYDNLKNYKKAIAQMDEKIEKIKSKLK